MFMNDTCRRYILGHKFKIIYELLFECNNNYMNIYYRDIVVLLNIIL